MKFLNKFAIILLISVFLNSCGGGFKLPKPGDARTIPSDGRERARKNIEEGRGVSAKDLFVSVLEFYISVCRQSQVRL